MPYTPNYAAGDVLTAAAMNSIGEAWSSFGSGATGVSWKATIGDPELKNGTWSAQYCQINKVVVGVVDMVLGSTTLVGSGNYEFVLPVTAKRSSGNIGTGTAFDGFTPYGLFVVLNSTTRAGLFAMKTDLSFAYEYINPTVPFTWGNGDTLRFHFTYEAA